MTLSERRNAALLLHHTTAVPFIYCRYFYKCFFCSQHYTDLTQLMQHTATHSMPDSDAILKSLLPKGKRTVKVDISTLKCKDCLNNFSNLKDVREHLVKEHQVAFTESKNGVVEYNLKLKDGQYECHLCNKIFQTFILLNRHMNTHFSNAVCETCGAGFMTHQRLIQHKEIHLPGGYPCKLCGKVYTTNSNLKYHIEKVHEGSVKSKLLRCPHCLERFSEHFRKLKHLKEVHGITFTFQCDVCKTNFESRRSLTMHTNKYHSAKTRCEVCQKSFGCYTTLKKHMVCHTGERNYICSLCQKTYRHQKSLKQHMNTHIHLGSELGDSVTCSECGSAFENKDEFNKHVKEWHSRSYFNFALN